MLNTGCALEKAFQDEVSIEEMVEVEAVDEALVGVVLEAAGKTLVGACT
jgi:hypothetical protein